eukprot:NODE_1335_length_994_cov_366.087831_g927_i0.p1 GENE.NODE_1335_length_994_cov_366.087831_g927_i0~~NODE_1335_length_994_cov_366.087831_g927_i0.p1  ORF type:complete len:264 (-),score=46.23 NODE_1335_length_994_cov_366.087831_g927_i0:89-880(-)
MAERTVTLQGKQVPFTIAATYKWSDDTLIKVVNCKMFMDWVAKTDAQDQFAVKALELQHVDFFGPRVGFLKFKVMMVGKDEKEYQSVIFMRGRTVGVLIILECQGQLYTLLTIQPRLAVAQGNFPEMLLGMLDEQGTFIGPAAQELKEETGITLKVVDLTNITTLIHGDRFPGVYNSPGLSDEHVTVNSYHVLITPDELDDLRERLSERDENDLIALKLIPLQEVWQFTPDSKTLSAVMLFQELQSEGGRLPAPQSIALNLPA